MTELTLYRTVGAMNRVALGDLAKGVTLFSAEQSTDGVITLTPVTIIDGSSKPAAEDTDDSPTI